MESTIAPRKRETVRAASEVAKPLDRATANEVRLTARYSKRLSALAIWVIAEDLGGFKWIDGKREQLALPGERKNEPTARLEFDRSAATLVGVNEFHVVMDLDTCSLHHEAFDTALRAARAMSNSPYAQLLSEGRPVTPAIEKQLRARVQAAQDERSRAEREAKTRTLADGTRVEQQLTSFVTLSTTKRGRHIGHNYFDVPELNYVDGKVLGVECFRELLTTLAQYEGRNNFHDVAEILMEAGALGNARNDIGKASRSNVADPFMRLVGEALYYYARRASFDAWLQHEAEQARRTKEWWDNRDAEEREKFKQRMAEGKAKKQRRAALDNLKAPKAPALSEVEV